MELFSLNILPEFKEKPACLLDLNYLAKQLNNPDVPSRFLNSYLTNRFLSLKHRSLECAYSFGGYLEDRSELWRGSYLGHDNAIHLGIDVNVPEHTEIAVKYPSKVISIVHDPDQQGGWGSTILFSLDEPVGRISHFLYAHLSHNAIDVTENQSLNAGQTVGRLGSPHVNGGWYEHLHVQAITSEAWHKFKGNLFSFDGYGQRSDIIEKEHKFFPNPFPLL